MDAFALAQKLRSVGLKVDIPFASQLVKVKACKFFGVLFEFDYWKR